MRQNVPNIDLFSIEVDGGNKPIFVPADIKHNEAIHIISTGEMLPQMVEGVIVGLFDNSIPIFQRGLAIRMLGNKFLDTLISDDVHTILYLVLR